jgi:hypothetical protein
MPTTPRTVLSTLAGSQTVKADGTALRLWLRRGHQRGGDFFVEAEAEPVGAARRKSEGFRTAEGRAERERASAKVFDAVAVAGERFGPVTAIHGAVEFLMCFQ